MRFNFANLRGGGKPKAADESQDADEEKAAEEEETSEEETEASSEAEADGEGGEDEASAEATAAHRRGVAAGRKAERERCAAIFAAASPAQVEMAANMAFNTKVTPAEAKALLGAAPSGGGLAGRMKGQDPAPAGGGEASGSEDDKVAARILSTRGRKAG